MMNKEKDILSYMDELYPEATCELNYTRDYELLIATVLSAQCTDKRVNEITKEERTKLVQLIKNLEVTLYDFRPIEEAIVTAGGVDIKEINPKTMESKIVSGLYFAGEIIDVDAYTGGFNLQIAYSTGYTAGGASNV